jgi:hypothetical protein
VSVQNSIAQLNAAAETLLKASANYQSVRETHVSNALSQVRAAFGNAESQGKRDLEANFANIGQKHADLIQAVLFTRSRVEAAAARLLG